jgi:hypothetical protein
MKEIQVANFMNVYGGTAVNTAEQSMVVFQMLYPNVDVNQRVANGGDISSTVATSFYSQNDLEAAYKAAQNYLDTSADFRSKAYINPHIK